MCHRARTRQLLYVMPPRAHSQAGDGPYAGGGLEDPGPRCPVA
jgi:hypothetical protein